jgi:hypothetical protein
MRKMSIAIIMTAILFFSCTKHRYPTPITGETGTSFSNKIDSTNIFHPLSVIQDSNGGFVMTGYTINGADEGGVIIRTDSNGDEHGVGGWTYPDSFAGSKCRIMDVIQASDGNLAAVGYIENAGVRTIECYRMDLMANVPSGFPSGYGTASGYGTPKSIKQLADGTFAIVGSDHEWLNLLGYFLFEIKFNIPGNKFYQ